MNPSLRPPRRWAAARFAAARALDDPGYLMRQARARARARAEWEPARVPVAPPQSPPRPLHADWLWRPALWAHPSLPAAVEAKAPGAALCGGIGLFHDDPAASPRAEQLAAPEGPAPHALCIQAPGFGGSFLSLAIDLPAAARDGFNKTVLLGVRISGSGPAPVMLVARLNIRYGPNTAQAELVPTELTAYFAEFDLAAVAFDAGLVSHVWCDLIFSGPGLSRCRIDDVVFSRRPRAPF